MRKLMLWACVASAFSVFAEVRFASVFGDGMVLQREKPVRVWGTCSRPGDNITVFFAGEKVKGVADSDGKWQVELPAMVASKESRVLRVVAGKVPSLWNPKNWTSSGEGVDQAVIQDVLVGEVWFCSGQSNTDCPIWGGNPRYRDGMGALSLQMVNKPWVRLVKTPHCWTTSPKLDVKAKWLKMTPELFTISQKGERMPSAMGYYYALELANALDVPIGLVDSSVGGTNIDSWTPKCGLMTRPDLKDVMDLPLLDDAAFKKAREAGGAYAGKGIYGGAIQQPQALWNGMVAAYVPMAIRGFIWYQGCHNSGEPQRYASKMHALYNGWSKAFANPDLKLYFVQLAPWGNPCIPAIQEAQAQFEREEPHSGMVVINDAGNLADIHPNDKRVVAKRLAAHALKRDYGWTTLCDNSPTLKSWRIDGNQFVLTFNEAKAWYVYNPNRSVQTGFEVAGADGKFVPAEIVNLHWYKGHNGNSTCDGVIKGTDLIIRASSVKEPKKLRYLYSAPWFGSVYNESSLPLGAFHIGE